MDKVGIEDGGYRGNGVYDTKGASVSVDFIFGSNVEKYRNSIIMYIGSEHLTDDPLWATYGPKKSITGTNGKAIHGIAVPKDANKVYRSGFTTGEIWQSDHTFIATNGDLPDWCAGNVALLKNTSAKHSALYNTCAHVGANAGNGSSYEVRPANFFINDATKKPSVDKNVNCSDDKYWSISDFRGMLPSIDERASMTDYQTPWLFPTLADMCCVFNGKNFNFDSNPQDVAEVQYRLALLKKRTGINDWELTFWVSQEKDKDNATRFRVQPSVTDKPLTYNFSSDSGTKSSSAFVYPVIYF